MSSNMKKHFIVAACMALIAGMAWANDAEYYASGNQLVPLKQTSIRVTKEVLSIDLRDDGTAFVDVQYEFTNPENKAKTILMGFEADPPYSSEGDIHHSNGRQQWGRLGNGGNPDPATPREGRRLSGCKLLLRGKSRRRYL